MYITDSHYIYMLLCGFISLRVCTFAHNHVVFTWAQVFPSAKTVYHGISSNHTPRPNRIYCNINPLLCACVVTTQVICCLMEGCNSPQTSHLRTLTASTVYTSSCLLLIHDERLQSVSNFNCE